MHASVGSVGLPAYKTFALLCSGSTVGWAGWAGDSSFRAYKEHFGRSKSCLNFCCTHIHPSPPLQGYMACSTPSAPVPHTRPRGGTHPVGLPLLLLPGTTLAQFRSLGKPNPTIGWRQASAGPTRSRSPIASPPSREIVRGAARPNRAAHRHLPGFSHAGTPARRSPGASVLGQRKERKKKAVVAGRPAVASPRRAAG